MFEGSHFSSHSQPSSPMPELPSKKQSCLQASTLSPGMPVANDDSSLSRGLTHSGSMRSILPSPSLSMPSEHWVVPSLPPIRPPAPPSPDPPVPVDPVSPAVPDGGPPPWPPAAKPPVPWIPPPTPPLPAGPLPAVPPPVPEVPFELPQAAVAASPTTTTRYRDATFADILSPWNYVKSARHGFNDGRATRDTLEPAKTTEAV